MKTLFLLLESELLKGKLPFTHLYFKHLIHHLMENTLKKNSTLSSQLSAFIGIGFFTY